MQPFTILLAAVIVLSHLTHVGWGRSNTGRMWRYSGDGVREFGWARQLHLRLSTVHDAIQQLASWIY